MHKSGVFSLFIKGVYICFLIKSILDTLLLIVLLYGF